MEQGKEKSALRIGVALVVLMLAGRAMTLAFIGQVGTGAAGAPPDAWLMPLVGDAVIGLAAPFVAWLVLRGRGLTAFSAVLVWNALGIWDALSALLVHLSVPWPEFFMVQIFGWTMFVAASVMHAGVIVALAGPLRTRFVPQGS